MLYIGGGLLVRKTDVIPDVWNVWFETARQNINHLSNDTEHVIAKYFDNSWVPLFQRDIENDEHWADLVENDENVKCFSL